MQTCTSTTPSPTAQVGRVLGRFASVALITLPMVGCQSYRLRGLVTEGPTPAVLQVKANDGRLDRTGLAEAVIELVLDPASLSPKPVGATMSDANGQFEIPIGALGAGLLEYDLYILCRLKDHEPVYQTIPLPAANRRLVIVMAPGKDALGAKKDLIGETLHLGGYPDPRR